MPRDKSQQMPLFLIHGNGVDHRILKPLEQQLAQAAVFDCHFLDLPGFGQGPPLENVAGLPELADWLEQEIRAAVGEGTFALLGNSLGGLLCQEMADRFATQVQGILLIAPVVYPDAAQRTLPQQQVASQDVRLLQSLDPQHAQLFSEVAVVQNRRTWQEFAQWVLPGLEAANLRAMAKLSRRYFLDPLPVDRQFQHEFPVTILCGKQDHVTGYRDQAELLARYPHAVFRVVDQAGHHLHLEQPEAIGDEIRAWAHAVGYFSSSG